MAEQIISASGVQYGLIINSDGSITSQITGSITIGSVSVDVESIYVQSGANLTGSMFQMEGVPTSSIYNNPIISLEYSGTAIGSVWKFIGTGSYLKVLSYIGDDLTNISAWQVV